MTQKKVAPGFDDEAHEADGARGCRSQPEVIATADSDAIGDNPDGTDADVL
jgi:hypothetical protein